MVRGSEADGIAANRCCGVSQRRLLVARGAFLAASCLAWVGTAFAYVGDSFISIPGSPGHYKGKDFKNWIRAEANEWSGRIKPLNSGASDPLAGDKLYFGGPYAARPGNPGKLIVTLGINNPDRAQMVDLCAKKTLISELTYAESSDRARPLLELGARPAEFPAFWEYKLKNAEIVDCPLVDGAIEQAFVIAFKDIEWLNYDPNQPLANRIIVRPEDLPDVQPAEASGNKQVKAFLITWIAPATDAAEDQCPAMNSKPAEAEVFRYLSKEEAAQLRAKAGEKGLTAGPQTEARGPHKLNAVQLPAIVPDPGLHEPRSSIAVGLDLDGDDGSGTPPRGIRKHKNFVSPDGRIGIDNQLQRIMGCIAGYRGRKGYRNQTSNARRADGNITTLVEISGIDDEKNDSGVEVAIIYAMDKPIRDNAGSKFIANYTFRPTDDPNFALYNMRVKGRIVNGVVTTDAIPRFQANLGQDPLLVLHQARMRFEPQPDGSMKGFLAGYRNWKEFLGSSASGYSEGLFGYQQPALYYALKRHADGMQDPVTGEYNGISTVYEIDTVPAFLTPAPPKPLKVAQENAAARKTQ